VPNEVNVLDGLQQRQESHVADVIHFSRRMQWQYAHGAGWALILRLLFNKTIENAVMMTLAERATVRPNNLRCARLPVALPH